MKKILDGLIGYIDILVLVICLVLVLGIWFVGKKNDTTTENHLVDVSHHLEEKLDTYWEHMFDYVASVKGFYEGSEYVSQEELSTFVQAMLGDDSYPSILRFAVMKRVPNEEVKNYEKWFKETYGVGNYKVEIDDKYQEQYISMNVVTGTGFVATPSGRNIRLDPDRRKFVEQVDGGKDEYFAQIDNVKNVPEYTGSAFLIGLPIYKEETLWGFVSVAVSTEGLKSEILDVVGGEDVGWRWVIGDKLLAENTSVMHKGKMAEYENDVALPSGEISKFKAWENKVVPEYWNWLLGIGVVMSFIIYAMVYALSLSGTRAREIAEAMTVDLLKYKQALDSNNSHIIITDTNGKVIYANDSVTRLTGYTRDEILGNTPGLWGKQMPESFYKTFWDTIKNKKEVFRGEVTNRRKDGTLYTAEAIVSPIISNQGDLVGFVGAELDVTDRKNSEIENKKHTLEVEKLNDLMVDREMKMIELKKELENLKSKGDKSK